MRLSKRGGSRKTAVLCAVECIGVSIVPSLGVSNDSDAQLSGAPRNHEFTRPAAIWYARNFSNKQRR
jgi:hypothetical protein